MLLARAKVKILYCTVVLYCRLLEYTHCRLQANTVADPLKWRQKDDKILLSTKAPHRSSARGARRPTHAACAGSRGAATSARAGGAYANTAQAAPGSPSSAPSSGAPPPAKRQARARVEKQRVARREAAHAQRGERALRQQHLDAAARRRRPERQQHDEAFGGFVGRPELARDRVRHGAAARRRGQQQRGRAEREAVGRCRPALARAEEHARPRAEHRCLRTAPEIVGLARSAERERERPRVRRARRPRVRRKRRRRLSADRKIRRELRRGERGRALAELSRPGARTCTSLPGGRWAASSPRPRRRCAPPPLDRSPRAQCCGRRAAPCAAHRGGAL